MLPRDLLPDLCKFYNYSQNLYLLIQFRRLERYHIHGIYSHLKDAVFNMLKYYQSDVEREGHHIYISNRSEKQRELGIENYDDENSQWSYMDHLHRDKDYNILIVELKLNETLSSYWDLTLVDLLVPQMFPEKRVRNKRINVYKLSILDKKLEKYECLSFQHLESPDSTFNFERFIPLEKFDFSQF